MLTRADSDKKEIDDLKGATIALGASPQFKALSSALLVAQGVDPKTVKFTIVPDQTTFGALLASKQVNVISMSSAVKAFKLIDQYKLRAVGNTEKPKENLTSGSRIAGRWSMGAWFAKNRILACAP